MSNSVPIVGVYGDQAPCIPLTSFLLQKNGKIVYEKVVTQALQKSLNTKIVFEILYKHISFNAILIPIPGAR